MDRIPEREEKLPENPRRRLYMTAGIIALLLALAAGVIVTNHFFSQKKEGSASLFIRIKGAVSFLLFGNKPEFYFIDMEKNGKDYRLTSRDAFDVTYRDEFVIKDISTDVIFGKGVSADVQDMGSQNDFRVLLRGVDLVDRVMTSKGKSPGGEMVAAGDIHIKYRDEIIAAIPIRVVVTPQDWLRYAKSSEDRQSQIDYLRNAIAMNSQDVSVRKMLAAIYFQSGMTDNAIAQYQDVLKLKPGDVDAVKELFNCYMKVKKYDRAIEVGLEQIKLNHQDSSPYLNVARAYSYSGNQEKAVLTYQEALKIRPDDYIVRYSLAEAYEKTKNFAGAFEQYRYILEKFPGDEKALIALAGVSLKTGKYDDSIKWYKEVIKKQPRNASAYANIGLAYGGKGQWNEEIEYHKKAISINPKNPIVYFNLAAAYEKSNHDGEAVKMYEKVLKIAPGDRDAILRLANIEYKNKQYDRAVRLYEKILKDAPKNASVHANLGFAYGELKKYKVSADHYEKAIRNGIKDPQIHYNLANTYDRLGKARDSIDEYERYAAKRPTVEVLNILADYYISGKQYEKAIRAYKGMVVLEPRKAAGYSSLGYVYGLKNDVDKEIEYYKISLKYDAEDDHVYLNLGEAYEKKGMYQEALKAYTRAYGLNPDLSKAAKKIPQMKIRILQQQNPE